MRGVTAAIRAIDHQLQVIREGKWVKNNPNGYNEEPRGCLILSTPAHNLGWGRGQYKALPKLAHRALAWAIGIEMGEKIEVNDRGDINGYLLREQLFHWNDDPERTLGEVVDALETAKIILKDCSRPKKKGGL